MLRAQVPDLAQALAGQIVVTSSALPNALLRALLLAGCRAVVCRDAAAAAPAAADAAAFFREVYTRLQRGAPLPEVLPHFRLSVVARNPRGDDARVAISGNCISARSMEVLPQTEHKNEAFIAEACSCRH
jgi:hypothetical protein